MAAATMARWGLGLGLTVPVSVLLGAPDLALDLWVFAVVAKLWLLAQYRLSFRDCHPHHLVGMMQLAQCVACLRAS